MTATIPWTRTELNKMPNVAQYEALAITVGLNTDALNAPNYDKCFVAAYGTWDSSTLTLQGSVDGVNYITIKDANGTDVTWAADGTKTYPLYAIFPYIRGSMSSGHTPSVNLFLTFARGSK